MGKIVTSGFVLSSIKYGDFDRIIQVLTENLGVVTVKVRGANRSKSALSLASTLFVYGEYELFQREERYVLDSAVVIDSFQILGKDIESLASAAHMAEVVLDLERNSTTSLETFAVYRATMAAIKKWGRPRLAATCFSLRLLALHGFAPYLSKSVVSNASLCAPYYYSYSQRGLCLEAECNPAEKYLRMNETVKTALIWILEAPIAKYLAFSIESADMISVETFCLSFLEEAMEKRYKRLDWQKSVEDFIGITK